MTATRSNPCHGEIWRHFKVNLYEIITVAEHTETREKFVIYRALYGKYGIYQNRRSTPCFSYGDIRR